jgi:hypothetical protein
MQLLSRQTLTIYNKKHGKNLETFYTKQYSIWQWQFVAKCFKWLLQLRWLTLIGWFLRGLHDIRDNTTTQKSATDLINCLDEFTAQLNLIPL